MASVLDDEDYDRSCSSSSEDDSDAAIRSIVADLQRLHHSTSTDNSSKQTAKHRQQHRKKKNSRNHNGNGIDGLRGVVSELIQQCEDRHLFVPPPASETDTGKVWSSRIYGADKKQQRKRTERRLLEARIVQLEKYLQEQDSITHEKAGNEA